MKQPLHILLGFAAVIILVVVAFQLLTTESTIEPTSEQRGVQEIDWSADVVMDSNGNALISADDIPASIEVSEGSEFGVAGSITDAELSPDEATIALTVSGAAHSAGWLYDLESEELAPVAFQYGGTVEVEPWGQNSAYAVFTLGTPAGTDLIKVVNRNDIASFTSETGFVVEVPEELEIDPPFSYEFVEWREPLLLCFMFEETEMCMNVETKQFEL